MRRRIGIFVIAILVVVIIVLVGPFKTEVSQIYRNLTLQSTHADSLQDNSFPARISQVKTWGTIFSNEGKDLPRDRYIIQSFNERIVSESQVTTEELERYLVQENIEDMSTVPGLKILFALLDRFLPAQEPDESLLDQDGNLSDNLRGIEIIAPSLLTWIYQALPDSETPNIEQFFKALKQKEYYTRNNGSGAYEATKRFITSLDDNTEVGDIKELLYLFITYLEEESPPASVDHILVSYELEKTDSWFKEWFDRGVREERGYGVLSLEKEEIVELLKVIDSVLNEEYSTEYIGNIIELLLPHLPVPEALSAQKRISLKRDIADTPVNLNKLIELIEGDKISTQGQAHTFLLEVLDQNHKKEILIIREETLSKRPEKKIEVEDTGHGTSPVVLKTIRELDQLSKSPTLSQQSIQGFLYNLVFMDLRDIPAREERPETEWSVVYEKVNEKIESIDLSSAKETALGVNDVFSSLTFRLEKGEVRSIAFSIYQYISKQETLTAEEIYLRALHNDISYNWGNVRDSYQHTLDRSITSKSLSRYFSLIADTQDRLPLKTLRAHLRELTVHTDDEEEYGVAETTVLNILSVIKVKLIARAYSPNDQTVSLRDFADVLDSLPQGLNKDEIQVILLNISSRDFWKLDRDAS